MHLFPPPKKSFIHYFPPTYTFIGNLDYTVSLLPTCQSKSPKAVGERRTIYPGGLLLKLEIQVSTQRKMGQT